MNALRWLLFLILVAVCILACALLPVPELPDLPEGMSPAESRYELIYWKLRVPRTCLAVVTGVGLALSGLAFQAVFRNGLATPFTLGVSSGASLGAAAAVLGGFVTPVWGFFSPVAAAAFLGALASTLLVYGLAGRLRSFDTGTLLLAGVATSFFLSSLLLLAQHCSGEHESYRILRWIMGSLETVGYGDTISLLPWLVLGGAYVVFKPDELNLLAMGDEFARGRGLDARRERQRIFLAVSLMIGGMIAVTGPIGFVGLISPHICRMLVGPNHRVLIPATALFGAGFLPLCDLLSRAVGTTPLPVGVVTALLGGPFFLWLLLRQNEA